MDNLDGCPNLRCLNLSHNRIKFLSNLDECFNLVTLVSTLVSFAVVVCYLLFIVVTAGVVIVASFEISMELIYNPPLTVLLILYDTTTTDCVQLSSGWATFSSDLEVLICLIMHVSTGISGRIVQPAGFSGCECAAQDPQVRSPDRTLTL